MIGVYISPYAGGQLVFHYGSERLHGLMSTVDRRNASLQAHACRRSNTNAGGSSFRRICPKREW